MKVAGLMIHDAWEPVTEENVRWSFRKLVGRLQNNNNGDPDEPCAVPITRAAAVQALTEQLHRRPEMTALTDDDAWAWFNTIRTTEAVIHEVEAETDGVVEENNGDAEDSGDMSSPQAVISDFLNKFRDTLRSENVPWADDFGRILHQHQSSARRSLNLC